MTFNPVTSTKTVLVTKLQGGTRIYSHTSKLISGSWISSDATGSNWTACDSLHQAIGTVPGEFSPISTGPGEYSP